jgi:hypothetical protein
MQGHALHLWWPSQESICGQLNRRKSASEPGCKGTVTQPTRNDHIPMAYVIAANSCTGDGVDSWLAVAASTQVGVVRALAVLPHLGGPSFRITRASVRRNSDQEEAMAGSGLDEYSQVGAAPPGGRAVMLSSVCARRQRNG